MRCTAAWLILVAPIATNAQASVTGTVVADSARTPLAGAEVRAVQSGIVAVTDAAGRFRLRSLPAGPLAIITRALGFRPDTSFIDLEPDETLSSEIRLKRSVATLREVRVHDSASLVPAKLMAFEERRRAAAGGHFLDSTVIEKWVSRKTGDLLSTVSGVDVKRGGSAAYVTGTRAPPSLRSGASSSRPAPCFMDVYIDGALVYSNSMPQMPLFDVNSIGPNHIAAIEVYSGPANTPAQYNRTSKGCGVVLIWTK